MLRVLGFACVSGASKIAAAMKAAEPCRRPWVQTPAVAQLAVEAERAAEKRGGGRARGISTRCPSQNLLAPYAESRNRCRSREAHRRLGLGLGVGQPSGASCGSRSGFGVKAFGIRFLF